MANPYEPANPESGDQPSEGSSNQPGSAPGATGPQPPYGVYSAPETTPDGQQAPYGQPDGQQQAYYGQQQPYGQPYAQPYGTGYGQEYGQQQPSPQQPIYGSMPYPAYGNPLADQIRSNSTIVLVLGVLGLMVIPLIGSIAAWVWGSSLVRQTREAGLPEEISSNARIGRVLGIIGTVLYGVLVGLIVLLVVIAIIAGIASSY